MKAEELAVIISIGFAFAKLITPENIDWATKKLLELKDSLFQ